MFEIRERLERLMNEDLESFMTIENVSITYDRPFITLHTTNPNVNYPMLYNFLTTIGRKVVHNAEGMGVLDERHYLIYRLKIQKEE